MQSFEIKAKRENFCSAIRTALEQRNISHVNVLRAVNADLAQHCEIVSDKTESSTKASKITKATKNKEAMYVLAASGKAQWRCTTVTVAMQFDEWAWLTNKLTEKYFVEAVSIPPQFDAWLKKFVVKAEAEAEAEVEKSEA